MQKFEQAVAWFALVMGMLLVRAGLTFLTQSGSRAGMAILLAGPESIQKNAQADFLKRRYGLRTIGVSDLTQDFEPGRNQDYLLEDCAALPHEERCLEALARRKDLSTPIFIEIATRDARDERWDVDLVQSYYPDADVWTFDGTRPIEETSRTLRRLMDSVRQKEFR